MRSIRTRLTLIIIATSVLAVALVGVSARWITHSQFNTFRLEQTRNAFIDAATVYYQDHGTWLGAEAALRREIDRILGVAGPNDRPHPEARPRPGIVVRSGNERLERRNPFALANLQGITVIGNHRWRFGQAIPGRVLARGTPVLLYGQRIGTVTYDAPPELRTLERIYLRRTGQAILYAAIAAAALALLAGILATRFLTRPIRDLTRAIRKMRQGELEQSVPIRSQDELGDMARAFNDMSADVARAQRLREQMTADIAHDLRTPLSVLTGYLEGIREGVLDVTPATVDTMYQEATQLQRLVEDLRTLSMADAGRLTLQRQGVAAAALLQGTLQAFAPMAEQAGIRLELDVERPSPRLEVDPARLRQVLANLVGNALQHTSPGGRVRLRARRDGAATLLQVDDDGAGIPTEALPHIFERFYRVDASRSEGGLGSGLGLPIARSLVEAHGGSIAADSAPGRGTTISIRLPATDIAELSG